MAKTKRLSILLGAPLALAFSQAPAALETLSAPALVAACRAYQRDDRSPEALTCRGFILGYLSASGDVVAGEDRPGGFVARAMRTRGMRLSDAAEQRLNGRYCLPPGETLSDLAARVADDPRPLAEDAEAAAVMRRVLEGHYLCDAAERS